MESVNSIAALKEVVGQENSIINVLGYYEPGDGGSGVFYWKKESNDTDNSGTIIKPELIIGQGRWKRIKTGPVKPEWFGAYGDGIADDTISLRSALVYSSITKSSITLQQGKSYLLKQFVNYKDLPMGLQMGGAKFAIVIEEAIQIHSDGATVIFDNSNVQSGFTYHGIAFQSNATISGVTFELVNWEYFGRMLHFEGTRGEPSSISIQNCAFHNGYMQIALYDYIHNSVIKNNKFRATEAFGTSYGVFSDDCRQLINLAIDSNDFEGIPSGDAIQINNDNFTIDEADTNKSNRLSDELTYNLIIVNNIIKNYNSPTEASGIAIGTAGPVIGLTITGNQIENCAYGVHCEYNSTHLEEVDPIKDVIISNNIFKDVTKFAAIHLLSIQYTHWTVNNSNINICGNVITGNLSEFGIQIIKTTGVLIAGNLINASTDRSYYPFDTDYTGIYLIGCSLADISGNTIVKTRKGILIGGGSGTYSNKSITSNSFIDCYNSYNLDETYESTGIITINNNRHNGCLLIYDDAGYSNTGLTANNETIAGAFALEKAIFKKGAKPMGIAASKKSLLIRDGIYDFLKYNNLAEAPVLEGHEVLDFESSSKSLQTKVVTEFGMATGQSLSITITTTENPYVALLSGSYGSLIEGAIVAIEGFAISSPLIVVKIEPEAGLVYFNEAISTPLTGASLSYKYMETSNSFQMLKGSGGPTGSIIPDFIGQDYLDTINNKFYKAYGLSNNDWSILSQ